jgi:hypothetical protein
MLRLPDDIIHDVEGEAAGLAHGIVTLELHFRDSRLSHYKINREKSVVTLTQGEGESCPVRNYSTDKNKMSGGVRK